MNYYIIDLAGRFLTEKLLFETYDHNQALKMSYDEATTMIKRFKNVQIEFI